MQARLLATGLLLTLAAATTAHASYTDTFDQGANPTGWTSYSWEVEDQLVASGGNPGGYLATQLTSFVPKLYAGFEGQASPFVGDLAAARVTGMSLDVRVDYTDWPVDADPGFKPTVFIYGKDGAYVGISSGQMLAAPGQWAHFEMAFDGSAATLPAGAVYDPGWGDTPQSFAQIMSNVNYTLITLLQPGYQALEQQWQVSWDNIAVTTAAPVPEPASVALMGAGVLALMAWRRRTPRA